MILYKEFAPTSDDLSGVDRFCVVLWLLAAGHFFSRLPGSLPYCCVYWILYNVVITLLGKRELVALLFFGLWLVYCLSWFVYSQKAFFISASNGNCEAARTAERFGVQSTSIDNRCDQ